MESKNKLSIEEQLAIASNGAAPKGGGNYKSMIKADSSVLDKEELESENNISVATHKEEPIVEVQTSSSIYNTPIPNNYVPVMQYEPKTTAAYYEPTPAYNQEVKRSEFIEAKKETDTINSSNIQIIIDIADKYRSYESPVQESVKKFIRVDRSLTANSEDLSKIIYGVINVTGEEKIGLNDLVSLKEEERTSRAFSLIALSDLRLSKVKDLVMLFNPQYTPQFTISDKIVFCRELEQGIETLNIKMLEYIKPINELFKLVKE